MKHSITIFLPALLFLGIVAAGRAQLTITSQQSLGGSEADDVAPPGILRMQDGSYLISAISKSPVSGTKTSPHFGNGDGWVIKTDANGNPLWQKTFGGEYFENSGVGVEFPDALYFGFSSGSGLSGTKTVPAYGTGSGAVDYWLIKTDLNGNILWQKVYGTDKADDFRSMAVAPGNVLILAGSSSSDISIDKSENSRGGSDYWVIAIDSSGNKLWDKTFGGSDRDYCTSVKVLNDGLLLCGISASPVSGDKLSPNLGMYDAWFVKTDFNGNILWDRSIGGSKDDFVQNVELINGNIYSMGESNSPYIWNTNNVNKGNKDGWLAEMDEQGTVSRLKSFGSIGDDRAVSVQQLFSGEWLLCMMSNGNGGDKPLLPIGQQDIWLAYLDTNWNISGQNVIGGTGYDCPAASFQNNDGSIMMITYSASGIGANKQVPNYGEMDIWMFRFEHLAGTEDAATAGQSLKLYPNPAENSCQIVLPEGAGFEKLRVVNAAGQSVYESNLNPAEGGNHTLNTASWAPGAYFIDLQNKQGISLRSTLLKK